MNTLISLVLAAGLVLLCSNSLRKRPTPYYIAAAIIAAAVFLCQLTGASVGFPVFFRTWIWPIFFRGGLAGALFIIVMWTGALPGRSRLLKTLMPIRGELSILASILTLGHNAANGLTYFKYLFTNPARLPTATLLAACCSLVMICIMLPLFVTSFRCVRKKMKAKTWKRLQRLAYVFYGLLYVHLCLLYVPFLLAGRNYYLTFLLYSVLFIGYAVCRVLKYRAVREKKTEGLAKRQLAGLAAALVLSLAAALCISALADAQARASQAAEDTAGSQVSENTGDGQSAAEPSLPPEHMETEVPQAGAEASQTEAEGPQTGAEVPDEAPAASEEAEPGPTPEAPAETEAPPEAGAAEGTEYRDGTYIGTGNGYEGRIRLRVTLEGGVITEIAVEAQQEDPEFWGPALSVITDILEAQSTDVDAVSGSTTSSHGIMDAVDDALDQARNG